MAPQPVVPRVCVVGCGSIGQRHVRNLVDLGGADVLGVDPRRDRRALVATAHGIETRSSLEEAWKWSPDIVFVCTPTSLHMPPAIEAAARGCHLFIEKPLSHNRDEVGRLASLAAERSLVSMVACNLRFHPGLLRVKELVDAGSVGTVVACRAEFGQYLPDWRPAEDYRASYSARSELGGGVILDVVHGDRLRALAAWRS